MCGLCGNMNGDPDDDFYTCDDSGNNCESGDTSNVDNIEELTDSAIENTNNFGDSYCNEELTQEEFDERRNKAQTPLFMTNATGKRQDGWVSTNSSGKTEYGGGNGVKN